VIGKLNINGNDYQSLIYWYKDARKYVEEINKSGGAI